MIKKIVIIGLLLLGFAYSSDPTEGWQSLENWRKLESGLSPKTVRKILGEPARIEGGTFTYWHFPNDGEVVFYEGKLDRWDEPRDWDNDGTQDADSDGLSGNGVGLVTLIILAACLIIGVLPIIWVLASGRSHGGAKFGWFLVVVCFSWIGFAAFLILTQSKKKQAS
jgi:hypothetical protein